MSETRIVAAEASLAWCLTCIAFAAKAHWGYPASWLYAWRDALTITPEFTRSHPTFVCLHDHRLVGFHALVLSPPTAVLEHLWVLPAAMGKGLGRELFTHATIYSLQSGCRELVIESDPHAESFYRHMGAQTTECRESKSATFTRALPILKKSLSLQG